MPDPRAHQSTQTIEVMEVPEPRVTEAAGMAAWTPEDLRSFAKDLPNLDPQGGAPFAEVLILIADVCKLSLREIRILTIYGIQLKWGEVQGDWPESDLRFDWTRGSVYRDHVERLCERMRTTFPAVTRLDVVGYCVQKRGEMVADYFVRLEKVLEENVGQAKSRYYDYTEDLLKTYFLEGMHEPIRRQLRERCIGLDVESLSVVRQHAVHHERKLREAEEKKEKARVLLTDRWMKAEIRALRGGGGRRGRGSVNAGLRDSGCWTCGDPDHWARDCNGPRSGAPLCLTYMEEADSRGW
ncbi:uncharacterized protein LOC117744355 [Cyclopterus lumpus]|uniref:uncharacterized protein LOC117744355 n=1 Tax=Cyclopterus lumpus TaxID=8103 RepID=UPI001485DAD7|nr:uncharacterized protein LOC117744355 [Cyclopterus lumpus]